MKKINEILLVMIFVLTAVLAAAVGLKAYDTYDTNRQIAREQEELELAQVFARNEEAQGRVQEMQAEIMQLTEDKKELERFIAQIQNGEAAKSGDSISADNMEPESDMAPGDGMNNMTPDDGTASGDDMAFGIGTVSSNDTVSGSSTISGNHMLPDGTAVSGNDTASGNHMLPDGTAVSGNGTISGNHMLPDGGIVPGNGAVSANASLSENNLAGFGQGSGPDDGSGGGEVNFYDGSMTESSIFDAWRNIYEQPENMTLEGRRLLRSSLEETLEVNQSDRERIAENKHDFSGLKIACLGDSITAAANLENEENYQQYAYPARLKELLGAEEVYNLGIGGSSIGRYWADAYVDRYREIPEDTDVIIVMGGTNDGFCVSDKEFGSLEERGYRTFCGDLDELMRGLRENYPSAEIFFATPLPNILHDYLMSERDYLLPQQDFVNVILTLAKEYGFEVVDLYNSNILDSHDANIVADYVPDGVHANHEGYQIMAEHFASEIIQHYDDAAKTQEAVSANDLLTILPPDTMESE